MKPIYLVLKKIDINEVSFGVHIRAFVSLIIVVFSNT